MQPLILVQLERDVLTRVIIPFIKPGIFAGFFMALTYSLDDFAVTFFVTGNGFTTLSVEIYSMARAGITLTINALSGIIFLLQCYSLSVITLLVNVVKNLSDWGLENERNYTSRHCHYLVCICFILCQ